MAAAGIVEAVDVLEDGSFSLPACWPFLPPDQFRLQAFEERLDRSVVVAIMGQRPHVCPRTLADRPHAP